LIFLPHFAKLQDMPNTKSAAKAMRQALRRQRTNSKTKAKYKTATKQVKKLVSDNNVNDALKALQDAMSALDKAVKKGVLHKNTASRKKSRMAKSIARLSK
jgi:small subunit ribosomal protein S20